MQVNSKYKKRIKRVNSCFYISIAIHIICIGYYLKPLMIEQPYNYTWLDFTLYSFTYLPLVLPFYIIGLINSIMLNRSRINNLAMIIFFIMLIIRSIIVINLVLFEFNNYNSN